MERIFLLLSLFSLALGSQSPTRVFIITDAEGVAGVCRQDLTDTTNSEMRELLTGEVNAAVEGFLEAGADEVYIWDGHSNSSSLSALTIHPEAKLVQGSLGPEMLMDRGFSAVAFVGQHARANRSPAVMAHSYSSLGYQKLLLNGKEVGEIETRAALAGYFEIPVILITGDQAAAEDLQAIAPQAIAAVVKESLSYYSCISLSAPAARRKIKEAAQLAMRELPRIEPYKVKGPVTIDLEVTTRNTPDPSQPLPPGTQRLDARTLRFTGKDFLEAWRNWHSR
jgi:D-amino peptidase